MCKGPEAGGRGMTCDRKTSKGSPRLLFLLVPHSSCPRGSTEPRCLHPLHQSPAIYNQGESTSECGHIHVSILGYSGGEEFVGEIP